MLEPNFAFTPSVPRTRILWNKHLTCAFFLVLRYRTFVKEHEPELIAPESEVEGYKTAILEEKGQMVCLILSISCRF